MACLACQKVSATTATALSPTATTFLTPAMLATLAHILVRGADAAAAAGRHVAPHPLAREVRACRRKLGPDLRPVALQLLGHELGKPSLGALAHLGTGDANDHAVVGPDHHPGI